MAERKVDGRGEDTGQLLQAMIETDMHYCVLAMLKGE